MTEPRSSPREAVLQNKLANWVMAHLTGVPRHSRARSLVIIFGYVAVFGWLEYFTGPRVSLELLYLIPIALSVAWFDWRAGCITGFASIAVRVVGDLASGPYHYPTTAIWNRTVDLVLYFIIVWVLHLLISLRRQLEQRVRDRTADLVQAAEARRQLEHELLVVGTRERNLFGQELHDDICQHLVGTAFAAKVLAQQLKETDGGAAVRAQGIVDMLEERADKTRKLARGLLLSAIDPAKLSEKLAGLVAENNRPGVACHFREDGKVVVPDADAAAQLYRIGQEALRNALQHGSPRQVTVSLVGDASGVRLVVEDDGRGLPPAPERGAGVGLRVMSHRAAYIGGVLSVSSQPGQGTRVTCHFPYSATPV